MAKLSLNKETLVEIDDNSLEEVHGGTGNLCWAVTGYIAGELFNAARAYSQTQEPDTSSIGVTAGP